MRSSVTCAARRPPPAARVASTGSPHSSCTVNVVFTLSYGGFAPWCPCDRRVVAGLPRRCEVGGTRRRLTDPFGRHGGCAPREADCLRRVPWLAIVTAGLLAAVALVLVLGRQVAALRARHATLRERLVFLYPRLPPTSVHGSHRRRCRSRDRTRQSGRAPGPSGADDDVPPLPGHTLGVESAC